MEMKIKNPDIIIGEIEIVIYNCMDAFKRTMNIKMFADIKGL